MPAEVKILIEGWTNADSLEKGVDEENDACTTSLVRDGTIIAVVDPGIMDDKNTLIDALKKEKLKLEDITHVFLTHSHIDHYRNVGMFPAKTPVVEYWGVWSGNRVDDWDDNFSQNFKIIKTPGHSYDGLTFLITTNSGKVAICGDVLWKEKIDQVDEYAVDQDELVVSRQKVLEVADFVIPGHGKMFKVKK